MTETWRKAESRIKPNEVDKKSTTSGIYVRKNIERVAIESDTGETIEKYTYLECLMTEAEYNNYILEKNILNKVLDEDDTPEYQNYKTKLDEPVQYVNGFYYKPSYIVDYKKVMDDVKIAVDLIEKAGGDASAILSKKFTVYDASGAPENAVEMTLSDVINLYIFLYVKKEEIYNEYKILKATKEE